MGALKEMAVEIKNKKNDRVNIGPIYRAVHKTARFKENCKSGIIKTYPQ